MYWITSIKDTIKWFPFLPNMKHTENILKPNKWLIPSLLNVFAMFELRLIDDIYKVEAIAISSINCKNKQVYI